VIGKEGQSFEDIGIDHSRVFTVVGEIVSYGLSVETFSRFLLVFDFLIRYVSPLSFMDAQRQNQPALKAIG
jgi:hypothetical protein